MPERRGATRIGLLGRPIARAWDLLEVWLVDLSLTGARITLGELLPHRSSCTLTLPPTLGSLTLPAQVIWSATSAMNAAEFPTKPITAFFPRPISGVVTIWARLSRFAPLFRTLWESRKRAKVAVKP